MSNLAHSSFRDEARLYLLYFAAGCAAVPAGIAYAFLVATGWERWWTVAPLLAFGLDTALVVWKLLERKFSASVPAVLEACNVQGFTFGLQAFGRITAATSFVVIAADLPRRPHSGETNSLGQGSVFIASTNLG